MTHGKHLDKSGGGQMEVGTYRKAGAGAARLEGIGIDKISD